MDARVGIGDKWKQLLRELGIAAQLHVCNNDDGRRAAIIQLAAILDFFRGTAAERLTLPLDILLSALRDLQDGTAKPAKIFEPKRTKGRRRDDLALRTTKVVAAVIMDQLCEHLSRADAAKEVAKVFSEYGLSSFRGRRRISATAITKWRDQAKEAKDPELTRQFNRLRSMDTEVLGQDAPLELKRDFLLKLRLPLLLIEFGARGPKAAKTRQRLISDIGRQIPKKPTSNGNRFVVVCLTVPNQRHTERP